DGHDGRDHRHVEMAEHRRLPAGAAEGAGAGGRRHGAGGHQSTPCCTAMGPGVLPARPSMMRRTTGAADEPPKPPSSMTTATTYCGLSAGAKATNRAVSCLPKTWAVPVLPATGKLDSGKPMKEPWAV